MWQQHDAGCLLRGKMARCSCVGAGVNYVIYSVLRNKSLTLDKVITVPFFGERPLEPV